MDQSRATIVGVGAPLNKPRRLKPVDEIDHCGAIDSQFFGQAQLLARASMFRCDQDGEQSPVEAQWRERMALDFLEAKLRVLEQIADPVG